MDSPSPCRQPLLCGYYGEHNLGDDALLSSLLAQLPTGSDPVVTAFDEEEVRRGHGVRTCPRRDLGSVLAALGRCDALVLGGGSLLQDATSFASLLYYAALIALARLQGKPVVLWGQGLGPLRRRRSRLLVRRLLPLAQGISWRDPASAALAQAWGVAGAVGADPVWALPSTPWRGRGGPIVLTWRPTPQLEGAAWKPLLQALSALAMESGREVLWLPFHRDQDRDLLGRLRRDSLLPGELAERSRAIAATTPAEAMDWFAGAGLVLSMRLHGLIVAALAGAPCAALSYDPKVRAAAEALGCPCEDLGSLPAAESLQAIWGDALDSPPDARRIDALRGTTQIHREMLRRSLEAGS